MLRFIVTFTSLLLIFIIFIRIPEESAGLASFSARSNLLGSPRSSKRFLNILTIILIVIYFGIAILLNLSKR